MTHKTIAGFLELDGKLEPITIQISNAARNPKDGDYYCDISAPSLFDTPKRIFGSTRAQARELSLAFLKHYLGGRMFVDRRGRAIFE